MPLRPRRPCPRPRCPRFRPCGLHPTSTPYRGSSTAQGYGAGWHKISDRVLAEEPVCPGYERPCGDRTSVVDHIQACRRGGTDARSNLRASCQSCHSRKTVAQDRGWGNTPREPRRPRRPPRRVVNVASVAGVAGNAGQANYSAAKAGLIGFTKSVAREMASRNITCNAVAPGFVPTDLTNELLDKMKDTILPQLPLGRFGTVDDVASAIAFLASDAASYITAQVLVIDGGMVTA